MAAAAAPAAPCEAALQASRSAQSLDAAQEAAEETSRDSIRVYVRVRPPTEKEQALANQPAVFIDGATSSVLLRGDQTRSFTYDGVLGEDSTQEEVFDLAGRGVAASCLAGYNGSVYVYGQTGVGKTYTMSGPVTSVQSMQFDERRGLICRTLDTVFSEIHRRRARTDGISYLCRCSFLEIYKEQITDLLEPNNTNLQIREDMNRGVYVERLSEPPVSSLTEAFRALWRGLQQRHVGATHMNERSSRSHAVFTLSVEAAQTRAGVTTTRVARLSLVDLAGSERQHGVDSAGGIAAPHQSVRVKEAGAINRSLSALTNVVMSLSREERSRRRSSTTGDGRRGFVHYRDSKLTFLLRDSLGGNSKTVIVANVSPSPLCCAETLSTLKFASRAKHIRCTAVRNEEFSGTLESLMLEVKTLRQRLSDLGGRGFRSRSAAVAAGAETLASSDPETVEGSPTGSPREGGEEAQALYSRKRIRRLEVLLAAALARERRADQRQHQLQRLAGFLEDLDFRKTQSLRKLLAEYTDHISRIESSAVSNDEEGTELTAKLLSCRRLLGNLVSGSFAEDGAPPVEQLDELPLPPFGPGSGAAPGGTAEGTPGPLGGEVDAGTGAPAGTPPVPAGLVDEASFLQAENRRLRMQLEQHPEVSRLAVENRTLRAQLEALGHAGGAGRSFEKARGATAAGRGYGDDSEGSSDDAEPGAAGGALERCAGDGEASLPLTSEALLDFAESDDDGTLRTWVYVQKMAKEVEELLRAKDGLAGLLRQLREEGAHGPGQSGLGPGPRADSGLSVVELRAVEEVAQAAQEALRLAHQVTDAQRSAGGKGPEKQLSSKAAERMSTGPTPRGVGDGEGKVRQALQKVKDLDGTLDLVNSAYNEAYDEFQRLREEYESRLEECHFFEVQCSRLDMHCHELAERLHGAGVPVRAGMGSFSVAGLSPAQANPWKQKRSFSLSSLRDVSFWEQRFEELSQLTGIEEAEAPKAQPQPQPPT
uniref:Kinesin-like protein n=1 Tax=Alexandrium monilatum TaxID=311494 RepID=A0A7S4QXU1_9DINO